MLSILCITKNEPHAMKYLLHLRNVAEKLKAELVICADDCEIGGFEYKKVKSDGYLESVLSEAIEYCNGTHILRIDDDEIITDAMVEWLEKGAYQYGDVFAFPRCNMVDDDKYIVNEPLFPDLQTRLTSYRKAGGRKEIHSGSPYGTGIIIPVAIRHDKFIVRDYEARKQIAENYEQIKAGCGLGEHYKAFNLYEDVIKEPELKDICNGNMIGWNR